MTPTPTIPIRSNNHPWNPPYACRRLCQQYKLRGWSYACEDELKTYTVNKWQSPRKASLRARDIDIGGKKGPLGPDGLNDTLKILIWVAVALVVVALALSLFYMWRRRRQKGAARVLAAKNSDEKGAVDMDPVPRGLVHSSITPGPGKEVGATAKEMDATETARHGGGGSEVSELDGMARALRKPVPPVELDGKPIISEVGDAYIPYRRGK